MNLSDASREAAASLEQMLAPLGVEGFLESCWPDRLYVPPVEARSESVAARLALPAETDDVFASHRGQMRLAAPSEGGQTTFFEGLSASEAKERYEHGATVLLGVAPQSEPLLHGISKRLEAVTGVPPGSCDFLVHLSRPKTGFSVHFDNQDVLVLQVRGRKTWRIAQTPSIRYPTESYVAGSAAGPELRSYWPESAVLDSSFLPVEHERVVLEPGSVVFVPRGLWHWTEAVEESVSVSFGFHSPCWADVVAPWLEAALVGHDLRWKQPAAERWGRDLDPRVRDARSMLELLLSEVGKVAAMARAEALIGGYSLRRVLARTFLREPPTWARVAAQEARALLVLQEAWRQPAFSGWGSEVGDLSRRAVTTLASRLEALPAAVSELTVERLLRLGDRFESVDQLLAAMRESFSPAQASRLSATFQFHLAGDGGRSFFLSVERGDLRQEEGEHPRPDLTVSAEAAELLGAGRSWERTMGLFQSGMIRAVPADASLLAALPRIFGFWTA